MAQSRDEWWRSKGFKRQPRMIFATGGEPMYRAWGGRSAKWGQYFLRPKPRSRFEAERLCSVFEYGNQCLYLTEFRAKAGAQLFIGRVDPGDAYDPAWCDPRRRADHGGAAAGPAGGNRNDASRRRSAWPVGSVQSRKCLSPVPGPKLTAEPLGEGARAVRPYARVPPTLSRRGSVVVEIEAVANRAHGGDRCGGRGARRGREIDLVRLVD